MCLCLWVGVGLVWVLVGAFEFWGYGFVWFCFVGLWVSGVFVLGFWIVGFLRGLAWCCSWGSGALRVCGVLVWVGVWCLWLWIWFDLSVVLIWGFVDSTVFLWLGFVYVWVRCEILGFVSVVWFMPLAEEFGVR